MIKVLDRIAVVTAADSRYLPAACCTLLSCAAEGRLDAQVKFFIIACGASRNDIEKANAFLSSRGITADILIIDRDMLKSFRTDSYISASTYSRLLLLELFDGRWDRLLYLDADLRAMVDLRPLISIDLRGRPIGAVHDYLKYLIYGMDESRRRLGLSLNAPYFNAGVVCFDWHATIQSGLLQRAREFATENAQLCKSHDQDALNAAFEGAWIPIDPRWNFMTVAVPDSIFRLYYPTRINRISLILRAP